LSEDWQRLTMSFDDVLERADSVNKPKARTKAVKTCPHCHMEI
jgi:hypothetical protein